MKNILIAIVAIIGFSFSACYVGVEGKRHHPRHGTRIEIRASDNSNPKDSLQSPAMTDINQNDSLKAPVKSNVIK